MSAQTSAKPTHYLPVREDWLNRRREAALEPDLPIVDAHHHLWDRPGWRFLAEEMAADIAASGHNVQATVFVQAITRYRTEGPESLRPVGETEFVAGIGDRAEAGAFGGVRLAAGIVGYVDLTEGAVVQDVLEAHIAAGRGRFRGVRHNAMWDADMSLVNPLNPRPRGLLLDPKYREGFARLAPLGLTFDAWLFHPQIPELTDLARAYPDTTIILDHLGGPLCAGVYEGCRAEVFAAWQPAVRELATCPNVVVKLGGLGMRVNGFGFEKAPDPPSSETLAAAFKPYFDTCLEAFGPERCMFQSNFPVDKGSFGYGEIWNAYKRMTAGMSASERAALFGGTARRIYRL